MASHCSMITIYVDVLDCNSRYYALFTIHVNENMDFSTISQMLHERILGPTLTYDIADGTFYYCKGCHSAEIPIYSTPKEAGISEKSRIRFKSPYFKTTR